MPMASVKTKFRAFSSLALYNKLKSVSGYNHIHQPNLPNPMLCETPAERNNTLRTMTSHVLNINVSQRPYTSSLIIPDLLLQNNRVNTSLQQRKHRRRLPFQSSQRIQNFCAGA
jgi:hypothetical protein